MIQFAITDLQLNETTFEIPSALGKWVFDQTPTYSQILTDLERGKCGNTYYATNSAVSDLTRDADLHNIRDEIVDICLVLSFLNARCVTPSATTGQSDIQFVQFADAVIRPRAIRGFDELKTPWLSNLFSAWSTTNYTRYKQRGFRLQLSHWLSGLTCFSLEDVFLSVGVQMDIIKQQERAATNNRDLTYFQGMSSASSRYHLTPLGTDYKQMRNDIVHEGVLSGSNFASKSKSQCAVVVADTLNWLDQYVLSVLGLKGYVSNFPRWRACALLRSLPAISVR
jgi:hypothetical protein